MSYPLNFIKVPHQDQKESLKYISLLFSNYKHLHILYNPMKFYIYVDKQTHRNEGSKIPKFRLVLEKLKSYNLKNSWFYSWEMIKSRLFLIFFFFA